MVDEGQDLFIGKPSDAEEDSNDFYFSSLERYYFFDNENSTSYNINSSSNNSHNNSINNTGSSAASIVVTTAYQEHQASPSFASARQTLLQRIRQQDHNTHPHIEKIKSHWRTRFSHYHHASTVPSQWKHIHGPIPSPLFHNDDFSSGKIPISWDIQEERTIAQQVDSPGNEILKEIRLYNTIYDADNSGENKKLSPHIRHSK